MTRVLRINSPIFPGGRHEKSTSMWFTAQFIFKPKKCLFPVLGAFHLPELFSPRISNVKNKGGCGMNLHRYVYLGTRAVERRLWTMTTLHFSMKKRWGVGWFFPLVHCGIAERRSPALPILLRGLFSLYRLSNTKAYFSSTPGQYFVEIYACKWRDFPYLPLP